MRVLIQRASIVSVRFSGTGESTEAVLAHGVEAGLDVGIFEDNILTPDNTTALENYLSVSEDETSPGQASLLITSKEWSAWCVKFQAAIQKYGKSEHVRPASRLVDRIIQQVRYMLWAC